MTNPTRPRPLADEGLWQNLRAHMAPLTISQRGMLITSLADYLLDGTLPHHLSKPVVQAFCGVKKQWEESNGEKTTDPLSERLSEIDRGELTARGVAAAYIDQKLERATAYAKQRNRSVKSVLFLWWNTDKRRYLSATESRHEKSYDLDDFFAAALQRTYDETP